MHLSRLVRRSLLAAAVALLVASTAGIAAASPKPPVPVPAPEISPGAIGGAMTVLAGGLLLVRERFRAGRSG